VLSPFLAVIFRAFLCSILGLKITNAIASELFFLQVRKEILKNYNNKRFIFFDGLD
jgi:hypothetical protein|tara:strand:- start:433 stop:600 length:168 start_codon:yes stop_codon:yes gene_type:complete